MKGERQLGRYYAYVLFFIGSMVGLVLSSNLLLVFVFWEITALCSWALISFHNDDPKAVAGGRTKRSLKSANSRGNGVESIFKAQIDELSRKIAKSVGLSERRIGAAKMQVKDVTSGSPEAYTRYLEGREAFTNYDLVGARHSFMKAVELDPTFAVAYFLTSSTRRFLARPSSVVLAATGLS